MRHSRPSGRIDRTAEPDSGLTKLDAGLASVAAGGSTMCCEIGMTKTIGSIPDRDSVSDLLFGLSVTSTLYCISEMSAPWGFRVAARENPAFHLLSSGSAWLEVDGRPEQHRLLAGDLVILPRGDAHAVRDAPQSPVRWLERILADDAPVRGRLNHGGGGARSDLLCGGFNIDRAAARPLVEALPDVVHLHGHEGRAPEWLSGLVRMIGIEIAAAAPGTEAVVTRLTDALLTQALRQSLIALNDGSPGSIGIADPVVARAQRIMRSRPQDAWSVAGIAAEVGLSRSAFAQRFRFTTGEAPMRWLTSHRLARVAEYLRTTDLVLSEIARLTGYDSEVSISRAFRRQFGTAPGAYRRARRMDPARTA